MPTLTIVPRDGAYEVAGYLDGDMGPYDTKKEAEDIRRRLLNFEKFEDRPGYVTSQRS